MIPALEQATTDSRLTDQDVRVLTYLATQLDTREFQPIKQAVLARALHCSRRTIIRSLKRLVLAGYLERTPRVPGGRRCYRLVRALSEVSRTDAA